MCGSRFPTLIGLTYTHILYIYNKHKPKSYQSSAGILCLAFSKSSTVSSSQENKSVTSITLNVRPLASSRSKANS